MSRVVSPEYLAQCLAYDPDTGVLTWKRRPVKHFPSFHVYKKFKQEMVGEAAGTPTHGYLRFGLTIDGRHISLYAHRAAWCLMTGAWPEETVDHRDGDRSNNRWANLRNATRQQNLRNTPVRSHCKSGIKGVYATKVGTFGARITVDKKRTHLGTFATADEAQKAFAKRAAQVHGEFLHSTVQAGEVA